MRKNQLFGYAIAIVLFASCGKDPVTPGDGNNNPPGNDSTQLTPFGSALVQVERTGNEMEWVASELLMNEDIYANGKPFFGAGITTVKTTNEGKEILISFNSAATCSDGKKRSGKLLVEIDYSNNDILISPDGFKVNDTAISGTFSFERFRNPGNKLQMNLAVLNGKIGANISFSGGRSRVKTAGDDTPFFEDDDVFEGTTGNYYLTLTNSGLADATFLSAIKETYNFKAQRGFVPAAGRVEYTLPNGSSRVLNFGNGTVNAKAYME